MPADFTRAAIVANISSLMMQASVELSFYDDSINEPIEGFVVMLEAQSNGVETDPNRRVAVLKIVDNDGIFLL